MEQQQKVTTQEAKPLPPKDTRFKTEDVTSTKGLTFQSFGLTQDVLLVSIIPPTY